MSSLSKKEMEVLSSPTFQQIINQHLDNPSRRRILKGSVGVAALGFLGLAGCGGGGGSDARQVQGFLGIDRLVAGERLDESRVRRLDGIGHGPVRKGDAGKPVAPVRLAPCAVSLQP